MKIVLRLLWAVPLLVAAGAGHAAQLYKSTGPDGRVTYSDRPPAASPSTRVETIPIDTSTPEAPRRNAAAAVQPSVTPKPETDYERIIRRRNVADDSQVKAAEKALEAARAALQTAQDNSTAEDWQYTGGRWGRPARFPKPEYAARLEALEQQVKQAEQALDEAQRRSRLAS